MTAAERAAWDMIMWAAVVIVALFLGLLLFGGA